MLTHKQVRKLKPGDTLWRCYGTGIHPNNLTATVISTRHEFNAHTQYNEWSIKVMWGGAETTIYEAVNAFARWAISEAHAKLEWTYPHVGSTHGVLP